jgi:hypothetical protein
MARAGLAYAAMLAASVSAGALGYAVVWAFAPEEQAALTPTMSTAIALPAAVAAEAEPTQLVVPAVAAAQASAPEPKPEPAAASAPAIAAAPAPAVEAPKSAMPAVAPRAKGEPIAPARAQPQETGAVPQAKPADVARQSVEAAPAAPLPAADPIATRPAEGLQTPPIPGMVTRLPAEAPAVRPTPSPAVAPREHAPVGSTMRPAPPAALLKPLALPRPSAAAKFAALPPAQETPQAPAVASDAPQILIVRGGLRRATSVRPRRLGPVPPPAQLVQGAPHITVLRGGAFRSAHTSLLPVVQPPDIAVVRGARPAAAPSLVKLAAPGPLVLRIRD